MRRVSPRSCIATTAMRRSFHTAYRKNYRDPGRERIRGSTPSGVTSPSAKINTTRSRPDAEFAAKSLPEITS